jgi:hypothetical protein
MTRYEIEQAGDGSEHGPGVGTRAEPKRWRVVRVLNADGAPRPLRFDTPQQALAYVARSPDRLRIVEVGDEGERVPVETDAPC